MRSRRLIGMVISLLLIVSLLLVFTDPWSSVRKDGKRIALSDPDSIDKIIIFDLNDSTWLTRQEEEWLLFGEERVNPVAVENLLFAAERLQINSIVSKDSVVPHALGKSIKFSKEGKGVLAYRFWVQGNRYLVEPDGSDRSFQVSLAGYPDLNLDRVFSSSSNHYQEHVLIDLVPSEISYIEVELANGKAFGFKQTKTGEITCSPVNEQTTLPSGSLDDLATRLLFSYFTSVRYETKSGNSVGALTDSVSLGERMARLLVVSQQGEEYTLQVFPFRERPGDEPDLFRALVLYNNDPEILVVNYIYLDVLMRDLSHYIREK